jgi:amidase
MGDEALAFTGLVGQAEAIRDGRVSSRESVTACLERIARLDPGLNAFRTVYSARALAEADAADERHARGEELPLLGVPVAIKDDSDVAGDLTLFGSAADDRRMQVESEVVRRLREAGAVIVGKTNASELLMWSFTESVAHGATRNPWNVERTPGGSSGGSAAAVAAGMVPVALGSDGGGSVRIPAACCGIFGLKPQRDRISTAPHTDADHTYHDLAVYGPLARSVEDAAIFLDVTAQEGGGSFLAAARRRPEPLRVAVCTKPPPPNRVDPEALRATEEIAAVLRSLGHRVERRDLPWLRAVPQFTARFLRGVRESGRALPFPDRFEARTKGAIRLANLIPDRLLARVRAREEKLAASLGEVFVDADVLLTPALAGAAHEVGRWASRGAVWALNGTARFTLMPMLAAWNVTGQPAVAVPAGLSSEGLPLGVQLVGRPRDEATLLSLSAQLEAELEWADRRPPLAEDQAA